MRKYREQRHTTKTFSCTTTHDIASCKLKVSFSPVFSVPVAVAGAFCARITPGKLQERSVPGASQEQLQERSVPGAPQESCRSVLCQERPRKVAGALCARSAPGKLQERSVPGAPHERCRSVLCQERPRSVLCRSVACIFSYQGLLPLV